ncbi:MAG: GNAT family N-acetyltransferase [Timaviella obliquedivisa GSE-PSE-MK23-08B]|jgi:L-amino acid N-acyltransferase YncA|nr:GNAT family N-acetyltransferase [Timaviella obliquedivisa GSE-PSE-MK23-08B]
MQLPIQTTLKDGTRIELDEMSGDEKEDVRALLNIVIIEGQTYPQAQPLSEEEFAAYWMSQDTFVVRLVDDSAGRTNLREKIWGAFYLRPNFPGRCSHICNAGFIVQPSARGLGIGRYMGETMLAIARAKGYTAVMFNVIFSTNTPSLNLWKSLDFSIVGTIPNAVNFIDGKKADAVIMYRALE